jgi:pseudouridine synthase
MPEERLQKVLARAGVCSRRKAEELITAGRVAVNGQVVRQLGVKVDAARDSVEVDGEAIELATREYWLLHKPVGVITTVDDPWGRPTARELIPTEGRVFPVGRLDADSSGLLLFTNDGELAYRLTHPSFEHQKEYHVLVEGRPSADDLRRLRRGVKIDGRPTAPAEVDVVGDSADGTWLRVVLHEGRKRQVRRMMAAVQHPVLRLVRVRVGPITLGDLQPGEARRLTPDERLSLRRLVEDERPPTGGTPRQTTALT